MDVLIYSACFGAAALAAFLLVRPFSSRLALAAGLGFAAYIGLDDLATSLPALHSFRLIEGSWNWDGKFYSIGLSLLVILLWRMKLEAVGLTLKQRNILSSNIVLGAMLVWGFSLGAVFHPEPATGETLVYQALMPGLAEELAYRGIAPAILLGLIGARDPEQAMPWSVIVLTAVVFGLWHGLSYSDGQFSFDALSALFPLIGSIVGGWLRFNSGSLVFPFLAHGGANVAYHLAPVVLS